MGTNWYIDIGSEGDDYDNHHQYPHIGKFTFRNGRREFIFYMTKESQLERLLSMNQDAEAVSEMGERKRIVDLIQDLVEIPFSEQDFRFC